MSKMDLAEYSADDIYVQQSPWGSFFVWIATDVERLRRDHRIVGHLSFSSSVTSSSTSQNRPAFTVDLPLQLSLEETSLMLYKGIAKGVDVVRPITDTPEPTVNNLMKLDEALAQNRGEAIEILRLQKRQRMLAYYSEIMQGATKRASRKKAKSDLNSGEDSNVLYDCSGIITSKNRLKKLRRKKKRRTVSNDPSGSAVDYHDDDYAGSSDESKLAVDAFCVADGQMPTLEALTDVSSSGNADAITMCIPTHRPRPTPKEWRRFGEHTLIPIPKDALADISSVATWLMEQTGSKIVEKEIALLKCCVFADLWSRGMCITCGASKMGGDFLAYYGDPLFYHASHIVLVQRASSRLHLSRLSASLRIANSVRKVLVLATASQLSGQIAYSSMYWTGSRQPIL